MCSVRPGLRTTGEISSLQVHDDVISLVHINKKVQIGDKVFSVQFQKYEIVCIPPTFG